MRLRFTPRATANIIEIADFPRQKSGRRRARARRGLCQSAKPVAVPQMGRRQKTEGVRKLVTRQYGYLIYYMIDDAAEDVVILSVKHPARRREHEDV